MKQLRNLLSLVAFVVVSFGFAQENVFLKRDFWGTKPDVKTIETKIKEGNNPAEANGSNFDGVVYAILQDAPLKTIQHMISQKGNDANKLTHDGRTYIFWAAYKGNTDVMEYLLKKGAKTDLTDDKGNTILNFAASSGQQNTKVYDICIANGADLKKDLTPSGANALLLVAPYDNDLELIKYFQSKGLDIGSVDNEGNGVFNYVAKTGNIELLEKLQGSGVKGTDNAFLFAAYGTRGKANGVEVYEYLESVGLNPSTANKKGVTPLHIVASRSKDTKLVQYLLEKDLDVNKKDEEGNTPFMNAASRNDIEIVALLLNNVKDINEVNDKGQSALTLAINGNTPDAAEFLIKKGAKTSILDKEGNNLNYYLINSYSEKNKDHFSSKMVLLKSNGIDFVAPQENGNTWFHLAVKKQSLDLLKLAAGMGQDVNAKNKDGNTALHLAAMQSKNEDILKFLLKVGAKKDLKTDFEETAYDLAKENELLEKNKISVEFLK